MGFAYRLTFILPPALGLVPAGRHQPCLHGCVLEIEPEGLVRIQGPAREAVFEQAGRFLKLVGKGHGPLTIAARLTSPCGNSDGWTIIVGAEVAFAPTSLGADIYPPAEMAARVACLIIPLPVR